jgi:hypothetical protein
MRVALFLSFLLLKGPLPNAVVLAVQWNIEDDHPCTIQRMTHPEILGRFGSRGIPPLYPEPLVIAAAVSHKQHGASRNASITRGNNDMFRRMTRVDNLLRFFGMEFQVTLSSSNSLSQHKRTVALAQYIEEILTAQETSLDQRSNETWYLFGETYSAKWQELLQHYDLPPCHTCIRGSTKWPVALSFGIGNRGSGVQWHTHGPGFSEAVHGRKHWVLYAPGTTRLPPNYHKDQSSRQWMETVYATATPRPLECTLHPGDFLYFPDRWWHATINLDPYTAFVSSFTTEHGVTMTDEL